MVLSLCVNADLGTSADKAGGGGVYKADIVVQGQRSCTKKIIGYKVTMVDYGEARVFQTNVDF